MNVEFINCPYCQGLNNTPWATENGYTAVKCSDCGLVYVNPRPQKGSINEAVQTGIHIDLKNGRTAINRRVHTKVKSYKKVIYSMFEDVFSVQRKSNGISWLDVGAGYGEVVEAVSALATPGSRIMGIEPMRPKAAQAKKRGVNVKEGYLADINENFDYLSLVNVYSHIPDFRAFLMDVKKVLTINGEIFIETGNIGDLVSHHDVPSELDLPDHLVFAGERHIIGHLSETGYSIIAIKKMRKDGLINFAKNIVKKVIGRKVTLRMPYTMPYRSILIRAKLLPEQEC